MRCRSVEMQLPDYAMGILDANERAEIDRHVSGCTRCREDLRDVEIALSALKQDAPWMPPQAYWSSLLPRIHDRIEKRPASRVSVSIARFIAPVAAAIVCVILAVWYIPTLMRTNHTQSAVSEFQQIPQNELQDFVEQQSAVGIGESATRATIVSSDDTALLKELLQDEDRSVAYFAEATGDESILDAIPAQDADQVVSILEKNLNTKTD